MARGSHNTVQSSGNGMQFGEADPVDVYRAESGIPRGSLHPTAGATVDVGGSVPVGGIPGSAAPTLEEVIATMPPASYGTPSALPEGAGEGLTGAWAADVLPGTHTVIYQGNKARSDASADGTVPAEASSATVAWGVGEQKLADILAAELGMTDLSEGQLRNLCDAYLREHRAVLAKTPLGEGEIIYGGSPSPREEAIGRLRDRLAGRPPAPITVPLPQENDPAQVWTSRYVIAANELMRTAEIAGTGYDTNEIDKQAVAIVEAELGPDPADVRGKSRLRRTTQPLPTIAQEADEPPYGDDWTLVPAHTIDGEPTVSVEWRVPAITAAHADGTSPHQRITKPLDKVEHETGAADDRDAEIGSNAQQDPAQPYEIPEGLPDAVFLGEMTRLFKEAEARRAPTWINDAFERVCAEMAGVMHKEPLLYERLVRVGNAMLERYLPERGEHTAQQLGAIVRNEIEIARARPDYQTDISSVVRGYQRPEPHRFRNKVANFGLKMIGDLAFGANRPAADQWVPLYAEGHRIIARFADELEAEAHAHLVELALDLRGRAANWLASGITQEAQRFANEFNRQYGTKLTYDQIDEALRPGGDEELRQAVAQTDAATMKQLWQLEADTVARMQRRGTHRQDVLSWFDEDAMRQQAAKQAGIYRRYVLAEDERLIRHEPLGTRGYALVCEHPYRVLSRRKDA